MTNHTASSARAVKPADEVVMPEDVAMARQQLVQLFCLPDAIQVDPEEFWTGLWVETEVLRSLCDRDFEAYWVLNGKLMDLCGLPLCVSTGDGGFEIDAAERESLLASAEDPRLDLLQAINNLAYINSRSTGEFRWLKLGIRATTLVRYLLIKLYLTMLCSTYSYGDIGIGRHAAGTVDIGDAAMRYTFRRKSLLNEARLTIQEQTTLRVLRNLFITH